MSAFGFNRILIIGVAVAALVGAGVIAGSSLGSSSSSPPTTTSPFSASEQRFLQAVHSDGDVPAYIFTDYDDAGLVKYGNDACSLARVGGDNPIETVMMARTVSMAAGDAAAHGLVLGLGITTLCPEQSYRSPALRFIAQARSILRGS